jgi:hypothetical protein
MSDEKERGSAGGADRMLSDEAIDWLVRRGSRCAGHRPTGMRTLPSWRGAWRIGGGVSVQRSDAINLTPFVMQLTAGFQVSVITTELYACLCITSSIYHT